MNRVLDRLYIGDRSDLDVRTPLHALGFVAVLDLRDGPPPAPLDMEVMRVETRDGDPWSPAQVEQALSFVAAQVRLGKVLVACEAGMSRSAAMTIGYLVRCGMSPAEAYGLVKRARPKVALSRGMLEGVLATSGQLVEGFRELLSPRPQPHQAIARTLLKQRLSPNNNRF